MRFNTWIPLRNSIIVLTLLFLNTSSFAHKLHPTNTPPAGYPLNVVVYDGDHNVPLELARVALHRNGAFVEGKMSNINGRASFRDLPEGRYELKVTYVGYDSHTDTILVDETHSYDSVVLHETNGQEITVGASSEPPITTFDPSTGNQVFESETYHAAPTARMTELVQQNMMGAVRAPTGEVHVRGQHGEFSYYVDGAPIPLGVFGGLNEVVNPEVIQRAIFWNGGWPAEYGGQMAAVIDVENRVPAGRFHLDASTYGGSYLPNGSKDALMQPNRFLNGNGQQLSLSDNFGKFGFFLSGSRQETDRRIDPPVQSIFHDHGFDYFLYGKADYIIGDKDYLTLNLNYGNTYTQVPFDPLTEGMKDDNQLTDNTFQTLSYYHTYSSETDKESSLLIAGFAREGGLTFTPGAIDPSTFYFGGDTTTPYTIAEDRSFATVGVRTKFEDRLSHEFMYAVGGNFSATSGKENFTSFNTAGNGPAIVTDYRGSDFGLFAQSEWHPAEWTRFDLGLRYDQHIAPDIPLERQISPRIKWNFLLGDEDNAYLYYGRLFMPNNIEGLRSLSSNVDSSAMGTLAERDNFYEAVYEHSFAFGLRAKAAYFRKDASPGVDDQTVGSSAVKTPVNIAQVKVQGIDLGLSYSGQTPLSGYVNASLIHAYGEGAITGGFLPITNTGEPVDLDHDQRLSIVASMNYQPEDWYANLTATYGSGLTNGNPSGLPYETGLFAFNQFAHTTPSWILNASLGYTIHLTNTSTLAPSLYVKNLFDHEHLLKGSYFSGASWEEPREVILKLDFHV